MTSSAHRPMTSEERTCKCKARHGSQRDACKALAIAMRTWQVERGTLLIYLCRFCHGWHIGHKPAHAIKVRRLKRSK